MQVNKHYEKALTHISNSFFSERFFSSANSLTVKLAHDNKTRRTKDNLKVNAPQLTSKDVAGSLEQNYDLNKYSLYNSA